MKRLFSIIAVISVIAATGVVMTACGSEQKSSEATTAAQTTAQTTTAQETTAAQTSADEKQSSATESKTSESKTSESKTSESKTSESKTTESSNTADEKSDSGSGEAFAGISEEDAKAMALLDLVTEEPSVESCKQGKDKNDADCWIVMMKDAEGDRYISYVNAAGSTTLPYTE